MRSRFFFAGLAASAALVAMACSSSTDSPPPATSGGTDEGVGKVPPAPGPDNHPGDGTDTVFAVSKLYLGDVDRDGTADAPNGWKHFGFNLDGFISTKTSTNLCKPSSG